MHKVFGSGLLARKSFQVWRDSAESGVAMSTLPVASTPALKIKK
jgi:hypothetical protein